MFILRLLHHASPTVNCELKQSIWNTHIHQHTLLHTYTTHTPNHTYIAANFIEELFSSMHHLLRQLEVVALLRHGDLLAQGVGESRGGETLPNDVLVQTRPLLQLGDDVPCCHAHTDVHGHADTSEQGSLHTDDVMRYLQGGGEEEGWRRGGVIEEFYTIVTSAPS